MRRGLIIHQSPPAFWVKTSRTTQDTVKQEDTQGHPQRAQANHGTDTPSTPKAQTHTEANPHQPKAGKQWVNTRNLSATLFTGGNQSPRTQTPPAQVYVSYISCAGRHSVYAFHSKLFILDVFLQKYDLTIL